MNNIELLVKLKSTEDELKIIKNELIETKEHLKKYTAPSRSKIYYDNHKEEVLQKNKEYKQKTNYTYKISPEKKKEYARTAYLNKKDKLKKNGNIEENI
jgi:hypothetical protein